MHSTLVTTARDSRVCKVNRSRAAIAGEVALQTKKQQSIPLRQIDGIERPLCGFFSTKLLLQYIALIAEARIDPHVLQRDGIHSCPECRTCAHRVHTRRIVNVRTSWSGSRHPRASLGVYVNISQKHIPCLPGSLKQHDTPPTKYQHEYVRTRSSARFGSNWQPPV